MCELLKSSFLMVVGMFLAPSRLAAFGDFRATTTRSHVALHKRNSGAESGRELFKHSKDASLQTALEKKFFAWGVRIFCE